MAVPRTWLVRVDKIIVVLENLGDTLVDRSMVEETFGLQRRAAIKLLKEVGASTIDGQLHFPAPQLLAWVAARRDDEVSEVSRRSSFQISMSKAAEETTQMRRSLQDNGKAPTAFPVIAQMLGSTVRNLPEGVHIEKGLLTVRPPSGTVEECLSLLHALSLALCNDIDAFRVAFGENNAVQGSHVDRLLAELEQGKQAGLEAA